MQLLFAAYPIATFQLYNVSARPDLIDILRDFEPNARTYPQIWIDDAYIGGCDALQTYLGAR